MSKLVSLSNETYNTLKGMKGKNMSFSDVILELINKVEQKHDFLSLAGSLKFKSKELERFEEQIMQDRKRNTDR